MKYLLLVLALSGCTMFQKPIIETKLVYIAPPQELLVKPESVTMLDPNTATEKQFSLWIIDNFARFKQIENQYDGLVKWNNKQQNLIK